MVIKAQYKFQKISMIPVLCYDRKHILEISKNIYSYLYRLRKAVFPKLPCLHEIDIPMVVGKSFNDLRHRHTQMILDTSIYKNIDLTAGFIFVDKTNFINIIECDSKKLHVTYIFNGIECCSILPKKYLYYKGVGSHLESLKYSDKVKQYIVEQIPENSYILLTVESPAINKKKINPNKMSCQLSFDLSLPGGGKKKNESDHNCIYREFEEETGLVLNRNVTITFINESVPYSFMGRATRAYSKYAVLDLTRFITV